MVPNMPDKPDSPHKMPRVNFAILSSNPEFPSNQENESAALSRLSDRPSFATQVLFGRSQVQFWLFTSRNSCPMAESQRRLVR
jgi:hypothetical protein